MLPAGTAERHHEVLESTLLIIAQAGIDERHGIGEIQLHAFLVNEVLHYRRVLAREFLEALFAPRIRKAPRVENEATAVTALVLRQSLMK